MTKLTRSQMRLYQRERRARLRSQTPSYPTIGKGHAPASAVVDKALPRNATTKASDSDIAAIRAKIAAIGPSAVFPKTGGRIDAITVAAFKARQKAAPTPRTAPQPQRHAALPPIPPTPRLSPPTPSRALTVAGPTPLQGEVISPPRSMIADGGTPPRRYAKDANVAEATALIRAYAAEQAHINAETARRLDALERDKAERDRRVAALEDRQARLVGFVQGIAGVLSLIARGAVLRNWIARLKSTDAGAQAGTL
jgi:hypothetical protein